MQFYQDGRWFSPGRATVTPFNSAFLYGETVFEAVPLYGGKPLFFNDHLKRMEVGCRFLGWRPPSERTIKKILKKFSLKWGGSGNFMVRLGLVQDMGPGAGPRSFNRRPPVLFANARPLRHEPSTVLPRCGNVGVARWRLPSPDSYPFGFKTAFYLTARREMRIHPKWDEMLRLSEGGDVVDGFSSSPILVQGKQIFASSMKLGGLESVTRARVIDHCRTMGFQIVRKTWKPTDVLRKKSELVFVGSGVGILAVKKFQGKSLMAPGPVAKSLWDHYRGWMANCNGNE